MHPLKTLVTIIATASCKLFVCWFIALPRSTRPLQKFCPYLWLMSISSTVTSVNFSRAHDLHIPLALVLLEQNDVPQDSFCSSANDPRDYFDVLWFDMTALAGRFNHCVKFTSPNSEFCQHVSIYLSVLSYPPHCLRGRRRLNTPTSAHFTKI